MDCSDLTQERRRIRRVQARLPYRCPVLSGSHWTLCSKHILVDWHVSRCLRHMPEGHVKNLVAAQSFVSTTFSCLVQTWDFSELKHILPGSPAFWRVQDRQDLAAATPRFSSRSLCLFRDIGAKSYPFLSCLCNFFIVYGTVAASTFSVCFLR